MGSVSKAQVIWVKYTAKGVSSGRQSCAVFPTSLFCSHQHLFEAENPDFQSCKQHEYRILGNLGFLDTDR